MLRQYYSDSSADDLLTQAGVLAVISFENRCEPAATKGYIPVGLCNLSGQKVEVLKYANEIAERGIDNGCHWSRIKDVVCVATWLPPERCHDIQAAAADGYNRLLNWIKGSGHPFPFRIWNFIPRINEGAGDHEAYKRFCVGRQQAFDHAALPKASYPAASALGHHNQGGVIYMLASRHPGQHHENPKQQPAYHYPRHYGPTSPSFARATSVELGGTRQIMISGTASIIGHDTQAAGDLKQQLTITLENIRCLQNSIDPAATTLSAVRVYLRRAEDLPEAEAFLSQFIPKQNMVFVHADICRANLLVEIEAVAS